MASIDPKRVLRSGRRVGEILCLDTRGVDELRRHRLARLASAAGQEDASWRVLLDELVAATGSAWGHVWMLDGDPGRMTSIATDEARAQDYRASFAELHHLNPAYELADAIQPGTAISLARALGPGLPMQRSPYWNGVHRANGIEDELGVNAALDFPRMRALAVSLHSPRGRLFSSGEQAIVATVAPFLKTAAAVRMLARRADQLAPLVHRLVAPAIVADATGRRVELNDAAVDLYRRGLLFVAFDGSLSSWSSGEETMLLRGAIARACGVGGPPSASDVVLTREGLRAHLFVSPLSSPDPECPTMQALLVATRVDDALAPLSARQRRVAELLSVGATNAEIAKALEIGPETIRTHVKEIYRRLGVTSRLELARKLADLD